MLSELLRTILRLHFQRQKLQKIGQSREGLSKILVAERAFMFIRDPLGAGEFNVKML